MIEFKNRSECFLASLSAAPMGATLKNKSFLNLVIHR